MQETFRILHLEDIKTDAELVARALRRSNLVFEHLVLDKEADYRNALQDFNPDIILCDHSLPSFNSLDALRIMKGKGLLIPFILVTATTSEEVAASVMREGADDYILKHRLKCLPNAVLNAISKYRYEKERKQLIDEVHAKELRSQTALRNALNDLKKIMDASLDVICSIDEGGRFVNISCAAFDIWGYRPEEMIGRYSNEFVAPEDLQITIQAAAKIRLGVDYTMFENRYMHKNGSLVPMLWSARWDSNDRLVYCVAKNATEKKRLEQIVENKRQRYRDLFMLAPSAIATLHGPDLAYEMANPLYLKLTGKGEVVGKKLADVLPELAEQPFKHLIYRAYHTGESFEGYEMPVKLDRNGNGEYAELYLNFIYQPFKNPEGEVEGIFFFANDVTEQVVARKKIEESDKRFKQIVESAREGIWMLDKNMNTSFVNNSLSRILGYTAAELTGKPMHLFMKGDKKADLQKSFNKRIKLMVDAYETRFRTKQGKIVWVNLSSNPLYNENGEYSGALVMLADITERKRLQDRFIKQKVQQQKEIIKTTLLAQERERNYMGSELHDNINQLLAAAKLQMKIFMESTTANKEGLSESYQYIETAMEEIRGLSQRLVTHRFDEDSLADQLNQLIYHLSGADFISLNTINLQERQIHENIKLTLFRIAQEQLNNTIKYSKASRVSVLLFNDKKQVTLTIHDNGVGFNPKKKRTGVGLTNILNRAESYNGTVKIASASGRGCKMTVEIPLDQQPD